MKKKHQQKKQQKQESFASKVIIIGLIGGLFWGSVWYFFYIFSFTAVGPNYFLMPFALGNWKREWVGQLVGIFTWGILSIGIAALFALLFKKLQGVFPGIVYGLIWWSILFIGLSWLSPVIKPFWQLSMATNVTTICIFILYGVFITYSVSFEASEQNLISGKKEANYSNE